MKAKPAAPAALRNEAAPLLIGITGIRLELLGGNVGDVGVRQVMKHPDAPKPVIGGHARGSKALWSRAAVQAYLSRILESGKWPTELGVAA